MEEGLCPRQGVWEEGLWEKTPMFQGREVLIILVSLCNLDILITDLHRKTINYLLLSALTHIA